MEAATALRSAAPNVRQKIDRVHTIKECNDHARYLKTDVRVHFDGMEPQWLSTAMDHRCDQSSLCEVLEAIGTHDSAAYQLLCGCTSPPSPHRHLVDPVPLSPDFVRVLQHHYHLGQSTTTFVVFPVRTRSLYCSASRSRFITCSWCRIFYARVARRSFLKATRCVCIYLGPRKSSICCRSSASSLCCFRTYPLRSPWLGRSLAICLASQCGSAQGAGVSL